MKGRDQGAQGQGGRGGVPHGVDRSDDSSDRPGWAGPNPTEPKPSGMGGGRPGGSGTKKGGLYGDLYDIEWTAAGSPELDSDGNVEAVAYVDTDGDGVGDKLLSEQLGLDSNVTLLIKWVQDSEGAWELSNVAYDKADPTKTYSSVPGTYTIVTGTVDFGRTSVARSPDKVLQQQIDEFEKTLSTASAVTVGPDGRIQLTTPDGEVTVDSPLTNLALYAVLMGTDRDLTLDDAARDALSTAGVLPQALLAAAADKTGTITVDYVAYLDTALGINKVTTDNSTSPPTTTVTYDDLSSYTYTRSDVWSQAVIDTVFGGTNVVAPDGADAFAQAADDYLQVIEYAHDNPGVLF